MTAKEFIEKEGLEYSLAEYDEGGFLGIDERLLEEKLEQYHQTKLKLLGIADVIGGTPREKWENLKKYILTQTEEIDKETPWQNTEPEWWLEMQTIERNIRQYCP